MYDDWLHCSSFKGETVLASLQLLQEKLAPGFWARQSSFFFVLFSTLIDGLLPGRIQTDNQVSFWAQGDQSFVASKVVRNPPSHILNCIFGIKSHVPAFSFRSGCLVPWVQKISLRPPKHFIQLGPSVCGKWRVFTCCLLVITFGALPMLLRCTLVLRLCERWAEVPFKVA